MVISGGKNVDYWDGLGIAGATSWHSQVRFGRPHANLRHLSGISQRTAGRRIERERVRVPRPGGERHPRQSRKPKAYQSRPLSALDPVRPNVLDHGLQDQRRPARTNSDAGPIAGRAGHPHSYGYSHPSGSSGHALHFKHRLPEFDQAASGDRRHGLCRFPLAGHRGHRQSAKFRADRVPAGAFEADSERRDRRRGRADERAAGQRGSRRRRVTPSIAKHRLARKAAVAATGVTSLHAPQTKLPAPAAPSRPVAEATAADQAEDEEKHDRADKGVDDERDHADAEMNTELRQQPVADEGADQSDDQIADQAETAAGHHPAGKPSGDDTDDKNDQKTLVGKVHGNNSPGQRCPRANRLMGEKFHRSAAKFSRSAPRSQRSAATKQSGVAPRPGSLCEARHCE